MKLFKGFLHFLITLVSTFAFLTGWATLAHSLKPAQPAKQALGWLPGFFPKKIPQVY